MSASAKGGHGASARRPALLLLYVSGLLLAGCLESLSTTRLPGGAARNFFYYLAHNEPANANTYWAPDHMPANASEQVATAAEALQEYEVDVVKSEATPESDGVMRVTLTGHAHRRGEAVGPERPLAHMRLIEIGPGWRVIQFDVFTSPEP
ncbi:MAG TPA: hypothetical protein VM536_03775 [Chloroflexia bacterium]|nr:hypothetical protein [Chloroflexia bacterium]